jgi:hypothetical protein
MTQERVLLEIRDLILADLDFGASCVTDARDRLVYLDVDALLNESVPVNLFELPQLRDKIAEEIMQSMASRRAYEDHNDPNDDEI